MRDQSFNTATLSRMLRKSDFRVDSGLQNDAIRQVVVDSAIDIAENLFRGQNPLTAITSGSKTIYHVRDTPQKLVLRKLRSNIHQVVHLGTQDRNFAITNLIHFISEGVPYKLYRLDIKSF